MSIRPHLALSVALLVMFVVAPSCGMWLAP